MAVRDSLLARLVALSGWLSLLIGLLLPLVSLPPFAVGIWPKGDPLIIGFTLSSALAAFYLSLDAIINPQHSKGAWQHPLIYLHLALAIFSLCCAPLMEKAWLSVLGAPQSGMGALFFLQLTLLLVLCRRWLRTTRQLQQLTSLGFIVAILVVFLKIWDGYADAHDLPLLLIWVPSYYAWLIPSLWILLLAIPPARHRLVLAGIVLALLLLVTHSLTALLACILGLATYLLLRHPFSSAMQLPNLRLVCAGSALLLLLVPIACELWLPLIRQIPSLDDRTRLLWMLKAAMEEASLGNWLIGHGWGRIGDAFQLNLFHSQQRLWDNQWIFLQSDYFHAHHGLLEALHASGLIGMLLYLASIICLPLMVSQERLPLAAAWTIAHATLSALWFPLLLSVPVQALAMAWLIDTAKNEVSVTAPHFLFPGLFVLAGGLFTLSAMLLQESLQLQAWQQQLQSSLPGTRPASCRATMRQDDLAVARVLRGKLATWENSTEPPQQHNQQPSLRAMADCLLLRVPHSHTPQLLFTALSLMAEIHLTQQLRYAELPEFDRKLWYSWLQTTLQRAPKRTDQAIPWLTHLATNGEWMALRNMVEPMLSRNDNDPIALYFSAIDQLSQGKKERGMALIGRALALGIDRFIPVEDSIRQLGAAPVNSAQSWQ
ncbi:MAG: O-antigen ligase family protein [Magnetococcales bacterium]|nr:O-antigen ligase family protein [Magnetococcales bacterium]MBF0116677.1 O-antigen ligase family protein [Magnetococcales bacterium]